MDSASCVSSASACARASARKATLKARAANLAGLQAIELEELMLKQKKDKLTLRCNIDEAEAEESAYQESDDLLTNHAEQWNDPPLSQDGPILEDVFFNQSQPNSVHNLT